MPVLSARAIISNFQSLQTWCDIFSELARVSSGAPAKETVARDLGAASLAFLFSLMMNIPAKQPAKSVTPGSE